MNVKTELKTIDDIIKYVPKSRIYQFISEFEDFLYAAKEFIENPETPFVNELENIITLEIIDKGINYESIAVFDFGKIEDGELNE